MSQTSYSLYQAGGFKGQLYDIGENDVMSYAAETAVSFGRPVALGTDKEKQVLHATTGASAIGIAAATHTIEQTAAGVAEFAVGETVNVLKSGRIWVLTSDAVVAGSVANLTLADGTFTDAAVAAGIEAFTQFSARFITGTTGAGLAVVEIK